MALRLSEGLGVIAVPADRTDETVRVDMAWWGAEPTKTVTTLARNARGLGWSWVTSSTLVSAERWL